MSSALDNSSAARTAARRTMRHAAHDGVDTDRPTSEAGREALPWAVLDLARRICAADSTTVAARIAAEGLCELTECERAVVAIVAHGGCRLSAVSGLDTFDPQAELLRGDLEACVAALDAQNAATTVFGETAASASSRDVVFSAKHDDGRPTAVCLLRNCPPQRGDSATLRLLDEAIGPVLATKLSALQQGGWRRRLATSVDAVRKNRRLTTTIVAALAAVAFLPVPYYVHCDCELQPIVRRHVAAPFDGVLDQSLCRPGDVVVAGQALGRLDAKELNWELAGVKADRDRAVKSRDVNAAAGKTAAAQIDRLEAQRLDERRKLLDHRLTHLEVKSPVAGVVVSGDMERAQGAPVKVGQTLFEVAPLDRMVVEAFVPESEIERIRVGRPFYVKLESHFGRSWQGTVTRVHPRAELHDEANVFVVEAEFDNAAGEMRPGMKGRVAVDGDWSPLAWVAGRRLVAAVSRLWW